MRKYLKAKLIQLLRSSETYDKIISQYYVSKNRDALNEILAKLQEIAIKIGSIIEQHQGEGGVTVKYLEEYCEILWNISQCNGNMPDDVILAHLAKKRNEIITSLQCDIPERYEVVFLPYMASMWDSFASIWDAAIEDNDVDVYVVPIPYYEKDGNGDMSTLHYEGDQYPENVSIVDYRQYDIVERHPDVIFIHNPYDEYNSTTSVLPSYYACELRNYTDMLIYIPYFVGVNNKVAEHLCALPGSLYANKVIVESELVRETYIKCLHQFEEEKNCKGLMGNIEEKVVAIGSPKYDRVNGKSVNENLIPDEWNKMIVKEDGSRRKVVLYNTSIDAILNHKGNVLDKICETIEKTNQNGDVVLLWRPHPLLKSAIKANVPELYDRYCAIEDDYRKKSKGILDESTDLYRAIHLSDMYYGDRSSVVELYKQTKKMVMIQKYNDNVAHKNCIRLNVGAGVVYKDKLFFTGLKLNGLLCMELTTGNITFLKMFNQEEAKHMAYRDAYLYDNEAWLLPWKSTYIVRVNLDTFDMEYMEIPHKKAFDDVDNILHRAYTSTGLIGDQYIYMIPAGYDTAVVIDMKEHKLYPYYEVIDVQNEYCTYGYAVGEYLLMFMNNGDALKKLNLATGELEKMAITEDMAVLEKEAHDGKTQSDRYTETAIFDGMKLFVSLNAESITVLDEKTSKLRVLDRNDGIYAGKKAGYRVITKQGKLVVKNSEDIFVWSSSEKRFESFTLSIDKNVFFEGMMENALSDSEILKKFSTGTGEVSEAYISYEKFIDSASKLSDNIGYATNIGRKIWERVKDNWL